MREILMSEQPKRYCKGGLLNEPFVKEFSVELKPNEFKSALGEVCTSQRGVGKHIPLLGVMIKESKEKVKGFTKFDSCDVFVSHEFVPPLTSYGKSNAHVRTNLFDEMCNLLSAKHRQVSGRGSKFVVEFPLVPYVTMPSVDCSGDNPEETYYPVSLTDVRGFWSDALHGHDNQIHREYYICYEKDEIKKYGQCAVTFCKQCLDYVSCMTHLLVAEKMMTRKHEPTPHYGISENPKRGRALKDEFGYGTHSGTPRQFRDSHSSTSPYEFDGKYK